MGNLETLVQLGMYASPSTMIASTGAAKEYLGMSAAIATFAIGAAVTAAISLYGIYLKHKGRLAV